MSSLSESSSPFVSIAAAVAESLSAKTATCEQNDEMK